MDLNRFSFFCRSEDSTIGHAAEVVKCGDEWKLRLEVKNMEEQRIGMGVREAEEEERNGGERSRGSRGKEWG